VSGVLVADGDRPREGGPGRKEVEVAVGVLVREDGAFLLTSRPPGKVYEGYWEFPGGKVEPGERPEETLIRELREELGIAVKEPCLAPLTFASYPYETFHLLMPLYVCRRWDGFVQPLEGQALKWVKPRELRSYPMPPADEPLIPFLIDLVGP
jgi:8-oxo-dGTP diphosphatase